MSKGTSVFPAQKLTMSQKDENWKKTCVDAIISREGGSYVNGRSRKERMRIHYNLYNGIFDENDLKYVTNPYKVEDGFPATIQNFNIIKPKIDLLLGEETKRPFSWRVVQANDEVSSVYQEKQTEMLLDYTMSQIKKVLGEQVDENNQPMTPKQISEYISRDYNDVAEKTANHTLNYLKHKLNLVHEFYKGFKDGLIGGEEVYYVGIINGEPYMERVNPIYFAYDRNPDLENIEEGDWCVRRMIMSPMSVYDMFYDRLEEKDLDALLQMINGYSLNNRPMQTDFNSIVYKDRIVNNIFDREENFEGMLVNVWHVCWRSFKKVGFLKDIDEVGEEKTVLVDETYKPLPGENIEWRWIVEIWEGYRAGEDLYFGMQPVQYQHVSIDNPNSQRLPYVGIRYNHTNSRGRSLVDTMKPLQYMYLIVWYRLELTLARDKGRVFTMDVTQIPKSMGIDVPTFMHYLSSMGVAFINPYEEGWNVPGREGGKPSTYNQFGQVDLSMSSVIADYIALLGKIEDMIGELSGVTKQRQGSISKTELVGNVERAVVQSSHITESLFWTHTQAKRNVLTSLLDTAKVAWANSGKKKLHYILDDSTRAFIDIADDFLYADLDIYMSDSTAEQQQIEALKSLLQPAMQNGATLLDAANILTNSNMTDIKNILAKIEERRNQMMQQQAEQEQALEQMKIQTQQEAIGVQQEKNRIDEEDSMRRAETQIQVAMIQAESKANEGMGDTNINVEDNSSEFAKLQLQKEKQANDFKLKTMQVTEDMRSNRVKEEQKDEEIAIKRKIASKPTPKAKK